MSKLILYVLVTLCCVANTGNLFSQQQIALVDAIEIAKKYSVDFQENKVAFISDYLSFKHYQIGFLPEISFSFNPISYNRSYTERYDYENNITTYKETNTLSSNGGINISQAMPFTGGNISISSNISRLENFGQLGQTYFTASPLRVSFSQPLFTYNAYKWEKKEMPLKLKLAKIRLLQQEQELNQKTAELYFELVKASQLYELAVFEVQSSDTLFEAGKNLLEINRITPLQLADLQLKQVNATIMLAQREQQLYYARYGLKKHLGGYLPEEAKPTLTDSIPIIDLNSADILNKARETNPFYLEIKQEKIELERKIDIEANSNKLSANLNFSYGLNQVGGGIREAYSKPTETQTGSVSLTIPVVDYGKGRDNLILAKLEKETWEMRIETRIADFEHNLSRQLLDFDITIRNINNSRRAKKLAMDVYQMKVEQYKIGLVTLRELNESYTDLLNANENYVGNIASFWTGYYSIQGVALFDLQRKEPFIIDYNLLIESMM